MHICAMEPAPKTPLDRWMREKGRTDESLASELNITRSQLNRIRNGVSDPSPKTAAALHGLTEIPFAELFQRSAGAGEAAA